MAVSKAFAWTNSLVFQLQHTSKPLRNGNFLYISINQETAIQHTSKPISETKHFLILISVQAYHSANRWASSADLQDDRAVDCISSWQRSSVALTRMSAVGLLFNRCSGHTPVAGRGGRISAGFFGALEANAAF